MISRQSSKKGIERMFWWYLVCFVHNHEIPFAFQKQSTDQFVLREGIEGSDDAGSHACVLMCLSSVLLGVTALDAAEGLGRFLDDVGFAATGEAVASPRAVGGEEERWSRVLTES